MAKANGRGFFVRAGLKGKPKRKPKGKPKRKPKGKPHFWGVGFWQMGVSHKGGVGRL